MKHTLCRVAPVGLLVAALCGQPGFAQGLKLDGKGPALQLRQDDAADSTRKEAAAGNAAAQYHLGLMYQYGQGVRADDAEAVKWYRKAAAQGYASAQTNLGLMIREGRGVTAAAGLQWIRTAGEAGLLPAQLWLGNAYEAGRNVKPDPVESVRWYRKAAAQGSAEAREKLNRM